MAVREFRLLAVSPDQPVGPGNSYTLCALGGEGEENLSIGTLEAVTLELIAAIERDPTAALSPVRIAPQRPGDKLDDTNRLYIIQEMTLGQQRAFLRLAEDKILKKSIARAQEIMDQIPDAPA